MNDLEKKLSALKPVPQDRLAAKILGQLAPRPSRLPLVYSGLAGALIGAAAMFLLMLTLAKPQIVVVQEVIRETSVEIAPEPVKPTPKPSKPLPDYRPEIALFGFPIVPQRSYTLDLDAMLAERAEIARRSPPRIASVYPKFEIGRREVNFEGYRTFLEKEILQYNIN